MEHGKIKNSISIFAYTLLGWLFSFIVFPFFCLFSCLTGRHRKGLKERLGYYRPTAFEGKPRIWLHAASVGEAQATHRLVSAIRKRVPEAAFFITTATEHGKEVARQLSGDSANVFLAPLDLSFSVRNAVQSIRPDVYILLETELWPLLLHRLHCTGTGLFLANGRISPRSFAGYRLFGGFMRYLLGLFNEISVIGQNDAERFIALGADRLHLHVTGNIKVDLSDPLFGQEELADRRRSLGLADGMKVLICGSTRSGEEKLLLPAYLKLKKEIPDLVWFIAPRHLRRLGEVERLLRENGLAWQRLSSCREKGRSAGIILVDTLGELKLLYGLGTYIFCGGSLVDKGGHNIMEPVAWGKPVFYGPSMNDFIDAKKLLESQGIGFEVASAASLGDKILELERQPRLYDEISRHALALAGQQRNVAERQAAIITGSC